MSTKNDKWVMFRNYMANELGISKADIREWIMEAVHQEVTNVVKQAYGKCDLESIIKGEIYDNHLWGEKSFKNAICQEVAKILAEKISISTLSN